MQEARGIAHATARTGGQFLEALSRSGVEGVAAKRLDGRYEPGRRSGSSKIRINTGQEFVIGGFTPGSNSIDALVVGYHKGQKLIYAARVRARLVPTSRRELYQKLKPLIVQTCPFVNLPEATPGRWGQGLTTAKMKERVWVKPKLVANSSFSSGPTRIMFGTSSSSGLRSDKIR
jgi:bifunctional non-homologous end joining protein LigD